MTAEAAAAAARIDAALDAEVPESGALEATLKSLLAQHVERACARPERSARSAGAPSFEWRVAS